MILKTDGQKNGHNEESLFKTWNVVLIITVLIWFSKSEDGIVIKWISSEESVVVCGYKMIKASFPVTKLATDYLIYNVKQPFL